MIKMFSLYFIDNKGKSQKGMEVMTGIELQKELQESLYSKTVFFSKRTGRPSLSGNDKDLSSQQGQALTEYTIIMLVCATGLVISSMFVSFDNLQFIFFDYHRSIADFLNLSFF